MGYTYEDRLNILKLTALETRRLRGDLGGSTVLNVGSTFLSRSTGINSVILV